VRGHIFFKVILTFGFVVATAVLLPLLLLLLPVVLLVLLVAAAAVVVVVALAVAAVIAASCFCPSIVSAKSLDIALACAVGLPRSGTYFESQ
jgi:hypothetical protein